MKTQLDSPALRRPPESYLISPFSKVFSGAVSESPPKFRWMQKGVKFQLRCSGCRDVSRGSSALFYECVKQREAERSVLQLLPGELSRDGKFG